MIDGILPACVVSVEARQDLNGAPLFPEEEVALGVAVEKRRREFTTARACARAALGQLGLPPVAIPAGAHGEPCWPANIVGSITHCRGYRACALARMEEIVSIGIDAEPHSPLPAHLLPDIARTEERPMLRRLGLKEPGVHWDRLIFSAKESVYKAWFPLAKRWLGFEDATVTIDPEAATFTARLLVPGPTLRGAVPHQFTGRWAVSDGILLTAITVHPA